MDERSTPAGDARCATGVQGLDAILAGGVPRECFYLIQGDPGSGKTTLALQFLLEGIRRGERVFYVTLSETKAELDMVARSHGWSLEQVPLLELSALDRFLQPESQSTVFHVSEVELNAVSQLLTDEVRRHRPERVVVDSLSELRLMAETPLRYRRQLLALKQEFARHGSTALLLDDKIHDRQTGPDPHVLSIAHGVIELEQLSPDYGRSRRRLRVLKMRGVSFHEGYHDYAVQSGGLRIFPRLVAADHHAEFERESVSSGIPELDALLGGGLDRGTATLVVGQAGTGKSTLALQYATRLAARGERSVLFAFDETRSVVLTRAEKLGLDLAAHVASGCIALQQIDPAEISPGEFASRVVDEVARGARLVIIDTLNGYLHAMPGEKYLSSQLHELTAFLNQNGVMSILTLAQHGLVGATEVPIDLSYLSDTVVQLRFFEAGGAVKKAISVLKKRSGPHEPTIREFRLEPRHGLWIGPPLVELRGILTGVPIASGATAGGTEG